MCVDYALRYLGFFSVGFLYEAQCSHPLDTYRQNCVSRPFWLVIMKVLAMMVIDGDNSQYLLNAYYDCHSKMALQIQYTFHRNLVKLVI